MSLGVVLGCTKQSAHDHAKQGTTTVIESERGSKRGHNY